MTFLTLLSAKHFFFFFICWIMRIYREKLNFDKRCIAERFLFLIQLTYSSGLNSLFKFYKLLRFSKIANCVAVI